MVPTNMALSPEQPLNGQRVLGISRWSAGADRRREKEERVSVCTVNVGTLIGKRREVVEMLARRKVDWEVQGRRPRGRPRKTWMDNVKEDMRMLNMTEDMIEDRQMWRNAIARQTLQSGNN